MSNICDFDRILKTEYNLQHFTRNCRIKNLDDFEWDEADAYLWRAGFLNVKEKGMTIWIVYKKTDEWYIKWEQVTTSDTTSDNEWQRVTTNDNQWYNEWQRVVQRMTASDNEWPFQLIFLFSNKTGACHWSS